MNEYLAKLNQVNFSKDLLKLKEEALENKVPIIQDESLMTVLCLMKSIKAQNILEIGTAVGYSAINFVSDDEKRIVDTIERDENMYQQAIKNIKQFGFEKQINVIYGDALTVNYTWVKKYDVIFIDAAKAQYQKFFEKYLPYLKDDGIIITDNILFHGLVEESFNEDNDLSKNIRNLTKKIDHYNEYLNQLEKFKTYYLAIGDGLAITVKK